MGGLRLGGFESSPRTVCPGGPTGPAHPDLPREHLEISKKSYNYFKSIRGEDSNPPSLRCNGWIIN